MPRPKRTKIGPSIPIKGGAGRTNFSKVRDVHGDISNDEERGPMGGRRGKEQYGVNARVITDKASSLISSQRTILEDQRKRTEAALERLEAENLSTDAQVPSTSDDDDLSSPIVEVGRRATTTAATEASILATGNFRRRRRQRSVLGRSTSRARSSSVESNLAQSVGLTKIHPVRNSVLVKGGFRRRQRQPSVLGRANSRVRSSSVDLRMNFGTPGNADSAMGTGMSSTGSRQSSTSGTRDQTQQGARGIEHDYESKDEGEDEEEFNPEDESTPLNLSKTISVAEQKSQSTSSVLNSRKRKFSPLLAPSPSPRMSAYGSEVELGSSSSPHRMPAPEGLAPPTTPERYSDIMAPPRSSSPSEAASEVLLPSRRTAMQPSARSTRRQPTRRPLAPPNPNSPPSSPPSLTHSPNYAIPSATHQARGRTRTRPQPADYSTLQLQAMLPRRRRRAARDPYEFDSSDDTEVDVNNLRSDEDELTHLTTRTHRINRATTHVNPSNPGPSNRRITRLKRGPKVTPLSKSTSATSHPRKNLAATSDKENQPESDGVFHSDAEIDLDDSLAPLPVQEQEENSQELEARIGKELKDAKRKFEVVDRWELEFEDCTGSSSPWEGR